MKLLSNTRTKIRIANGAYRLIRLGGWKTDRVVSRNGIRFALDLKEGIDLSLFLFGSFQKHVFSNPKWTIPIDATVIDIGANIGSITLPLAKHVSNGRVYAFEPTNFAFAKLKRNLDLNPELASRVDASQVFLGDHCEGNKQREIYSSWRVDALDGTRHPVHGGIAKAGVTESITLDSFVRNRGLTRVDFIKIDTDGHELPILRGSVETLQRFHPKIVFELSTYLLEERGVRFEEYEDLLLQLGYKLYTCDRMEAIGSRNIRELISSGGTMDVMAVFE